VDDEPDFGVPVSLSDAMLVDLYDTAEPNHEMLESNLDLFDQIERGQAVYVIVYRGGKPDELFFAGYSCD